MSFRELREERAQQAVESFKSSIVELLTRYNLDETLYNKFTALTYSIGKGTISATLFVNTDQYPLINPNMLDLIEFTSIIKSIHSSRIGIKRVKEQDTIKKVLGRTLHVPENGS